MQTKVNSSLKSPRCNNEKTSMIRTAQITLVFLTGAALLPAQPKTELLWPGGAPGAAGTQDLDKPSLTFYPATGGPATGTGVIVCPGGGYRALAMDHEGHQIAEYLNK